MDLLLLLLLSDFFGINIFPNYIEQPSGYSSFILFVGESDNDNLPLLVSIFFVNFFCSSVKSATAAAKITTSYFFEDSSEMTVSYISSLVVTLMILRSEEPKWSYAIWPCNIV